MRYRTKTLNYFWLICVVFVTSAWKNSSNLVFYAQSTIALEEQKMPNYTVESELVVCACAHAYVRACLSTWW